MMTEADEADRPVEEYRRDSKSSNVDQDTHLKQAEETPSVQLPSTSPTHNQPQSHHQIKRLAYLNQLSDNSIRTRHRDLSLFQPLQCNLLDPICWASAGIKYALSEVSSAYTDPPNLKTSEIYLDMKPLLLHR
jgi:hypothetical protein